MKLTRKEAVTSLHNLKEYNKQLKDRLYEQAQEIRKFKEQLKDKLKVEETKNEN